MTGTLKFVYHVWCYTAHRQNIWIKRWRSSHRGQLTNGRAGGCWKVGCIYMNAIQTWKTSKLLQQKQGLQGRINSWTLDNSIKHTSQWCSISCLLLNHLCHFLISNREVVMVQCCGNSRWGSRFSSVMHIPGTCTSGWWRLVPQRGMWATWII